MNKTILSEYKNNKFYIKSDFFNFIDNVIFYDDKSKKKILEIPGRCLKFSVDSFNYLYNDTQQIEQDLKSIILLMDPVRKIKENLSEKNHFYISKKDKYCKDQFLNDVYININTENIMITEGEEIQEEMMPGRFYIYKKYYFKNLLITYKNYKHLFFTKEDADKLNYDDFRRFDIYNIDKKIKERSESLYIKQVSKYIDKLKELKENGFCYVGHEYNEEEGEALSIKIFDRSFDTKEKQNRDSNIKYLRDVIYNDKKISDLFNKFNINIDEVKFND